MSKAIHFTKGQKFEFKFDYEFKFGNTGTRTVSRGSKGMVTTARKDDVDILVGGLGITMTRSAIVALVAQGKMAIV